MTITIVPSLQQCQNHHLIHLGESDFQFAFYSSVPLQFTGVDEPLKCIYQCLKAGQLFHMALYLADERKCTCLEVVIGNNIDGSHEVLAVDLKRQGMCLGF